MRRPSPSRDLRTRTRRAVWWAATAAIALVGPATAAAQTPLRPRVHALLIGIDRYAQPTAARIPPLRGAGNDVRLVRDLLRTRFDVADGDIRVLLDEEATHAAIVAALDDLRRRATAAETVLVWFSGHGSQIPDPSGRDPSPSGADTPRDQTVLACDSRAGDRDGSFDLTDDELQSLLVALPAADVVLVTDCCHAGGLLRGGTVGTRAVPPGRRALDRDAIRPFWPSTVPWLDDDRGNLAQRVVHIAACAGDETAGELDTPDGPHGTLSWHLCDELRRTTPDCSWRELGRAVAARIAGSGRAQSVRIAGQTDRAVLGGTARPVPPGFGARLDGRELVVDAGCVHGLGDGAELDVRDAQGHLVGAATVVQTLPHRARARWATAPDLDPATPLWVLPRAGFGAHPPLRVRLGDGVPPSLLAGCGWARPAGPADQADCALQVAAADDGALLLVAGDGVPPRAVAADAQAVAAALLAEHSFRSLWHVVAAAGPQPMQAQFVPPTADERAAAAPLPAAELGAVADTRLARATAPWLLPDGGGALAVLELRNDADRDLFVAVLSLQEDRQVTLIAGDDPDHLLRRGGRERLPVRVGPSPRWRGDRPMRDRYLVLATPRFADFRPLVDAADGRSRRGAAVPAPWTLLAAAPADPAAAATGGTDQRSWGVDWIDLQLAPPAGR